MRSGSTPDFTASCTAATSDCTRPSGFAAAAPATTRQPESFAHVCHCAASSGSTTAMAGLCAAATDASRLIVTHARADLPGQLFDIIGLLQRGDRKNEAIVLLQLD